MPEYEDEQTLAFLAEIRATIADTDPVPPAIVAAAKACLTWRTIDAELAELVEDSVLAPTAGVRSQDGPRLLTFEAPALTVVVEVTDIGPRRRMLGQLVQPQPAEVEVRHADGSVTVTADELGRFSVGEIPGGPVSLACRMETGERVVTSWVTV